MNRQSLRGRGRPPYADVLTPAEWRVVHAVQHGMTNREIAARRGITIDAVKFHLSNAMAKLGIENRRALRHWQGVPKRSALERNKDGGKKPSRDGQLVLGQLGQVSRSVRDIKESEAWYGQVLGLPHLYTFGKLAFFDLDGTRLFLMQQDAVSATESILYLRVEDIHVAYDTLKSRSVEFQAAPHMIHKHADGTEEWMAFFTDPEGRPLAIMMQAKPAA